MRLRSSRQRGVMAVELGLICMIMFVMIFGTIEVARAVYLFNTLQESTRRAAALAAVTNFADSSKMAVVRQSAIFRDSPGALQLGTPITDEQIAIDYLAEVRGNGGELTMQPIATGDLPSCPARNREICMADPNDARCIRFVRVRICQAGGNGACTPVPYEPVTGLIKFPAHLPTSTTIAPAESLGFVLKSTPC
ncbi:MAG: TadE/TadG family type IV pilus assembly protein [Gammaproteobacteria bacterium]